VALQRLRNAIGRVEASWRPASAEEGFEIVRRRLFEPLVGREQFVARDMVARAYYDLYRTQHEEFPPECRAAEYEQRMRAAYPIHPEVFDRLYNDWSTLLKFQRTRGVLRLMAAVIHSLWEKGDRNALIMPCTIPIDDQRVRTELTRYLTDNWVPVLERDVDGPGSLSLAIDGEVPNVGRFSACRRLARTIYLGSAPTVTAAHHGLDERRIKLGCVMPGESPAVFGDALRRLSAQATYLYQDGVRYWYSTQPTVTKLAEDRAEQMRREPDKVAEEAARRVREDIRRHGDFARVHAMAHTGQDVSDEQETALVVLGMDAPYSREPGSAAVRAAQAIWESRGAGPRLYRNTLACLAVDQARLQDLDEAVRRYLAWENILSERDVLDLSPYQVKQAEAQLKAAAATVETRLPEAYQWLLVPVQQTPQAAVEWQAFRLTNQDGLAMRASKKLRSEELLITSMAGTMLRMHLDKVPLWRGDHVSAGQLMDDCARYPYLPRVRGPEVVQRAVDDGAQLLTWRQDTFAVADSYDEEQRRYIGLRGGQRVSVNEKTLVVRAEIAAAQMEAQAAPRTEPEVEKPAGGGTEPGCARQGGVAGPRREVYTRFHASAELDAERVGRDAVRIAEEVIAHLKGLPRAKVRVRLEVEAEVPDGVPEKAVRTVKENCRALKLNPYGFEAE